MSTASSRVTTVALPSTSRIVDFCATPSFADAYAVDLPEHATGDPERLARFVFARRSAWMGGLMRIRDAIVGVFGLKTAAMLQRPGADRERRVGLFRIYEKTRDEIVLGEDDRHLDFRLSVLRADAATPAGHRRVIVSTVVLCHNALGRAYIRAIAPFHRLIVRASLRNAARAGWPEGGGDGVA